MSFLLILVCAVGALFVIASLWLVGNYNTLIHAKNLTDEGWSGIDIQLKRRYDLIPNLVSVAKQYGLHEKNILEEVTRLRSQALSAPDRVTKAAAEEGLTHALKTIFAVAENYPNLKANENFLELQRELSSTEDKVAYARQYYNDSILSYNNLCTTMPGSFFAGLYGRKQRDYLQISEAERKPVKVKFE